MKGTEHMTETVNLNLYQSDWNPPRTNRSWERLSMTTASAERAYAPWLRMKPGAAVTECVGWFDDNGACRQVAFAFDDGRHMLIQHQSRGSKITFPRITTRCAPHD